MDEEKYIWEKEGFRKDPYRVPEGYFADFAGKVMERLKDEAPIQERNVRLFRPWMAWVSGAAALIIVGWMGIRNYYWMPLQENRFQESIALMVDYYGEELHEGELAGYFEDNRIEVLGQGAADMMQVIQIEPDMAEEYIYESVGY
jgi:hypothetical protein